MTDKDKAESFNFFSAFTQEQMLIPTIGISTFPSISDLYISLDGVCKQLSQPPRLNPRKACGPDEIPARVLKEVAQSVSNWLSFIFDHNMVPSDWSKALVTAIHKKGSKSDPANYRPVSLTCICSKIMEHIILSHMSKHLSLHNILY